MKKALGIFVLVFLCFSSSWTGARIINVGGAGAPVWNILHGGPVTTGPNLSVGLPVAAGPRARNIALIVRRCIRAAGGVAAFLAAPANAGLLVGFAPAAKLRILTDIRTRGNYIAAPAVGPVVGINNTVQTLTPAVPLANLTVGGPIDIQFTVIPPGQIQITGIW
jgi:hypothetical protein